MNATTTVDAISRPTRQDSNLEPTMARSRGHIQTLPPRLHDGQTALKSRGTDRRPGYSLHADVDRGVVAAACARRRHPLGGCRRFSGQDLQERSSTRRGRSTMPTGSSGAARRYPAPEVTRRWGLGGCESIRSVGCQRNGTRSSGTHNRVWLQDSERTVRNVRADRVKPKHPAIHPLHTG